MSSDLRGRPLSRRVLLTTATRVLSVAGIGVLAACGQTNTASSGTSSAASSAATTSAASSAAPSSAATTASVASTAATTSAGTASTTSGTVTKGTKESASAATSSATTSSAATTGSSSVAAASTTATSGTASAGTGTAAGGGAALGPAGTVNYVTHKDVKGNITFWHFWGSPVRHNTIRGIINNFEAEYPGIKVTETAYPFGDIWTKNLAAVAAGSGMPDVIVSDRPSLRFTGKSGVYQSLDTPFKQDKIDSNVFWPFTWTEATIDGAPYGLPYETDIRVLYYNKAALSDGGLDPNSPPKDWPELDASAPKLDKKDSSGKLQQIAFYPTFGSFDISQWAWNNGGEWEDKDYNPTVNAPPNVAAMAWEKTWFDRYGYTNWTALKATFTGGNQDGFMNGKVIMKADIGGYISFLNFYNPSFTTKDKKNLGWGVAGIPPNTGHKPASLSGGFALSVPKGIKDLAAPWEFIKYAVFVGQAAWAQGTYAMPTVISIAKDNPTLNGDPNWKFLVDAMSYGRPAVYNPYTDNLLKGLGDAQDNVERGKQQPQAAMDAAQQVALQQVAQGKAKK
jgi:multiple sugar transport system substrate-binding protein